MNCRRLCIRQPWATSRIFLAGLTDLLNALGDGCHMRGVDRGQSLQSAARGNDLIGRVGATRHACIRHRIHAEAMPQAIIARRHTMRAGFLEGLLLRRMHRWLFSSHLRKGL